MSKINVLGFDVANLIAAGEVVDRPASVVKELLENAVDSGADEITVEIKNGGISHIRVSDNGCGIDRDDLPIAVLRHATSKIKEASDLENISTLGFRGEALAAIASVTKLKMYSRPAGSSDGAMMICEGGEIVELTDSGCAAGTTVIADELFYNVPARRKFLKRDATETAKITDIMEKVALSVPDISIRYICDGELKFLTQGDGDLKNTVHSVLGKRIASRIIPVDRTENGVRISGYVSDSDLTFSKRSQEIFYVNGRYIRSPLLMSSLERAYIAKIPEDKFPLCVLNVAVSSSAVDVNVHPTKLEVKFSNERIVSEALYYAVLTALNASSARPEFKIPDSLHANKIEGLAEGYNANKIVNAFAPVGRPKADRETQIPLLDQKDKDETGDDFFGVSGISSLLAGYDIPKIGEDKTTQAKAPQITDDESKPDHRISLASDVSDKKSNVPHYKIVGEAYDCYVIVELEDRILIIDKHAAHERILFEALCDRRKSKEKENQRLVAPVRIHLLTEEILSLKEYAPEIESIGFEFELDENNQELNITSVPSEISSDAAESTFTAILSRLSEGRGTVDGAEAEFFEKALYQAACKAAIKGGRYYGIDHIKWICDRLLTVPDGNGKVIKTCPHGRPVAFEIKKSSIERQFLRLE